MFEVESRRLPIALVLALLVSAFLHSLLVTFLNPRFPSAVPATLILPKLSVELRSFADPVTPVPAPLTSTLSEPEAAPMPDKDTTQPLRREVPLIPENAAAGVPRIPASSLDLSLPPLDADPNADEAVSGTVFSAGLLRRIADERRSRSALSARTGDRIALGVDSTSYSGGQWESMLRVGDLCFRVIEANPLDALSNEQWFRVDCD
jgi:hypothetical protein